MNRYDFLRIRRRKPRIKLTNRDLRHLFEIHGERSVYTLTKRTGLPYILVYNIVHKRVKSISEHHYRMLFGEPPPPRQPKRVHGDTFRALVKLWLFLNDGKTESGLYREFFGESHSKKPDYRIFNGQVQTVDYGLEQMMREKFSDAGIDAALLGQWLNELDTLPKNDRIPYNRIRPALWFIQEKLDVHPSSILHRSVTLYESGKLKSVSKDIYDRAEALKKEAKAAIATDRPEEIERLKETISGKKIGYTLYLEIADELQFLRKYAKRSVKGYLGRGSKIYETGVAKRIADWRADKIRQDCDRFIEEKSSDLLLSSIPKPQQGKWIRPLLDVLVFLTADLLSNQEGKILEKQILKPLHTSDAYQNPSHGFTRFELASKTLRMKPKAFDLMVVENCDFFRTTTTYSKRWYVSNLYLKELLQKEIFVLISAKYDLMAEKLVRSRPVNRCMQ